jgi:hypothetical protein
MTSEPTLPPIANRLAPLGFLVRIDLSWPYGSSTIKNPPSAVTATTVGLLSWMLAAGPSSPLAPNTPSLVRPLPESVTPSSGHRGTLPVIIRDSGDNPV